MKTLLNLLLKIKHYQRRHSAQSTSGFTMIELLVGMIIAFLIIVPMLAFVVDILNRDVREQAKANTEQDLQAAVDYITQDMSQALYVYKADEVQAIEEMDDAVRPIPLPANSEPILVFWKRSYEENALPSASAGVAAENARDYCEDEANEENCDDTFVMSLVAYYLRTDDNPTWCQPTGINCGRIAKAEISDGIKYNGGYINEDAEDTDGDGINDIPGRGFNPQNISNMKEVANLSRGIDDDDLPDVRVLVNYIDGFDLERVGDNQKLVTIKLVSNALRRSQNDFSCIDDPDVPTYKKSTYCPAVTVQLGGRSGFGE